ncbi:unnamed protein product [Protopolystoma xenopodis]|uniref:Uncharacterized protein n=1 Tax=Protopolystoma xenopodis TaxID=117903 RepID=A0A3S5BSU1_9PLAT|nr:unnamed protein product [Protopolystoma xenopodis]
MASSPWTDGIMHRPRLMIGRNASAQVGAATSRPERGLFVSVPCGPTFGVTQTPNDKALIPTLACRRTIGPGCVGVGGGLCCRPQQDTQSPQSVHTSAKTHLPARAQLTLARRHNKALVVLLVTTRSDYHFWPSRVVALTTAQTPPPAAQPGRGGEGSRAAGAMGRCVVASLLRLSVIVAGRMGSQSEGV